MIRHGKTASGKQRYRCKACCVTGCKTIDNTAKRLQEFLDWLLSNNSQSDMRGGGRSFRRRTSCFWQLWPLPALVRECYPVVYVDAIHLGRQAVVMIACNDTHVLGWYLARSENAAAWMALLTRIQAPEMVVTDGGSGFGKARKLVWPDTRVQRCIFHAFTVVRSYTTSRPRLQPGIELYALAKDLLHVKTRESATNWLVCYNDWCVKWKGFLAQKTVYQNQQIADTHQRLVKARNSLNALIRAGHLFTFLDPELTENRLLPSMNNRIEGAINSPLRRMLNDHRGMSIIRRIKAIMWWCYMHTSNPLSPAELLKTMPTDNEIAAYYQQAHQHQHQATDLPDRGQAIVWAELHKADPYHTNWD